MSRRLYILTLLTLIYASASAQVLDPEDYTYPMRGVSGLHAAGFGEMRPNHFHSGIDIKTDGAEGKTCVAVADGFVSRIVLNPTALGRALYITLDNGFTAVYGHLSRFNEEIETYLAAEQMRTKSNKLDLAPPAGRFTVTQGEVVAYSGNSGFSFGPHLHFEIRETATLRTLNLVRQGIYKPQDNIAPYILHIHYIETDTLRGVPVHRKIASYDVVKVDPYTYRLARNTPIETGANGHFVVEATDRRNGVQNRFGIYRATLWIDDVPHFEYRIDGFTFNHSRDCNAASYYPIQISGRNETIRLASLEGADNYFNPISIDRGVIKTATGELRTVKIEMEDDCGNTSHISFTIKGRTPWQADNDPDATACNMRKINILANGRAKLTIPAQALYESQLLKIEPSTTTPHTNSSVVVLSPAYRMLNSSIALRKAAEATIRIQVADSLQPHATMAMLKPNGTLQHLGGSYADGMVTLRTTSMGDMVVVADTTPPTIKPLFSPETDHSKAQNISFRIGDNFSGIDSCEMTINGKWVPCERFPIQNVVKHMFTSENKNVSYVIELTVRDKCGNLTTWHGTILR